MIATNAHGRSPMMRQEQQKRRALLIVENDAELRSLTAALFEDEQMDSIECESAEAAPAVLLIGGREVAMIFADVRLRGLKDGIDLAREVKMRWPRLPVILTSGYPRERVGHLPKLGFISRIGAVALWPNALVEVGVSLPNSHH
jgi:CheY-like chemotaxis protein